MVATLNLYFQNLHMKTSASNIARRMAYIGSIVSLSVLLAACASSGTKGVPTENQSGYLEAGEYARLQEVASPEEGVKIYRYKNPSFKVSDYKGVIIDPVVIYQTATDPKEGKGISEETIYQVRQDIDAAIKKGASNRFNVVNKPGPGVARISIAITGAQTLGDGFKPRDLVPVSAILNLASKAAGVDSKKPFLVVEAKVQDSVTGKILGEAVYTVEGETFRLESSSVDAFKELAIKWVRTALQVAAGERARAF
jgi:hypothetical protein